MFFLHFVGFLGRQCALEKKTSREKQISWPCTFFLQFCKFNRLHPLPCFISVEKMNCWQRCQWTVVEIVLEKETILSFWNWRKIGDGPQALTQLMVISISMETQGLHFADVNSKRGTPYFMRLTFLQWLVMTLTMITHFSN